jgi:hypothetical protein
MNFLRKIGELIEQIFLNDDRCQNPKCTGYYFNSDDYGWDHSTTYKKCNICNHIKEEK